MVNSSNKKNKGFTMVELLATVVILGILAGIGVPLVYRYLNKTKTSSYNHMFTGAYDAANNKILDENKSCTSSSPCEFKLEDLVADGYLETLDDPSKHGSTCEGIIEVTPGSTDDSSLKAYDYTCYLECSNYSKTVKWESGKAADDYTEVDDNSLKEKLNAGEILIDNIEIDSKNVTLTVDATFFLNFTTSPDNATETVEWSSSDSSIVSVDKKSGKLRGIGVGEAIITAKSKNKSAGIKVTVKEKEKEAASVSITNENEKQLEKVSLNYGESIFLKAKVTPSNITNNKLEWSSSNNKLVSTSPINNGCLISAIKNTDSATNVMVRTSNGKVATLTVTVKSVKSNVSVEEVSISRNLFTLKRGESINLSPYTVISPSYAADRSLVWSSSDSSALSVDKNGKVKALKSSGIYTVSAESTNGKKAYTTIELTKPDPSSVKVNKSKINLQYGESATVVASVLPADANQTITWDNFNCKGIVSVNSSGDIKVLKNEVTSCVLYARSAANKSADIIVNVLAILPEKILITADESLITDVNTIGMNIKTSTKLTAQIKPDTTTNKDIKWSSSNTDIASIDNDGTLTAKNPGTTVITASSNGVSSELKVSVKKPDVDEIKVEPRELSLKYGESSTIKATVLPADAVQTVTWDASDCNGAASVDKNGKVTVLNNKVINCNIRVKANNGKETLIPLRVLEIPVESISLNVTKLDLIYHETATLKATVFPANATNKLVNWSSSDPSKASITSDGMVRALKYDTEVTITATAGGKSVSIPVKLIRPVAKGVSVSSGNISLRYGEEGSIKASVVPADADQTITWDTTNCDKIISLSDGKIKVIQNKVSSCKLVAKASNGVSANVEVNILAILPTTLTIVPNESLVTAINTIAMNIKTSTKLAYQIKPDNVTNKEVSWKSKNPDIASIDNNGMLTANALGTTTIVASSNGISSELKVVVKRPGTTEIKLEPNQIKLEYGKASTIKATVLPSSADQTVTWDVSSCDGVVSIDKNGRVSVLKNQEKTCMAVAKTNDNFKAEAAIVIDKIPVEHISLNTTNIDLTYNRTTKLQATVSPTNATYRNVVWSSSDPSSASVTSDGVVKALKYDTSVTITATADGKSATAIVNLKRPAATKVEVNPTSLALKYGDEKKIVATVVPAEAVQTITWDATSCQGVLSVDKNGKVTVLKNQVASCKLIAKSNNNISAEVSIKVVEIPVESVSLNGVDVSSGLDKAYGTKFALATTVEPSNATNKKLEWTSSDKDLATVDSNGKVTIGSTKIGKVKITATSESNAKLKASIYIRVYPKGNPVDFSQDYGSTVASHVRVEKRKKAIVQSFAIDSGKLYLSNNVASGTTLSNISVIKVSDLNSSANYSSPNKVLNTGYFEHFGHLGNIDIETTNDTKYLWDDCSNYVCNTEDGETCSYVCRVPLSKIPLTNCSSSKCKYYYDNSIGTSDIKKLKETYNVSEKLQNIRYANGFLPAVDSKNRILLALYGTARKQRFVVYNLDDFIKNTKAYESYKASISKAKANETSAKPLYEFAIDTKKVDGGVLSRQGHSVSGNYIYSYEGNPDQFGCYTSDSDSTVDLKKYVEYTKKKTITYNNKTYNVYNCNNTRKNAYISVWTLSGEQKVARKAISRPTISTDNTCFSYIGNKAYRCSYLWEPEGLKVYNGEIYLGVGVSQQKVEKNETSGKYELKLQNKAYYLYKLKNN